MTHVYCTILLSLPLEVSRHCLSSCLSLKFLRGLLSVHSTQLWSFWSYFVFFCGIYSHPHWIPSSYHRFYMYILRRHKEKLFDQVSHKISSYWSHRYEAQWWGMCSDCLPKIFSLRFLPSWVEGYKIPNLEVYQAVIRNFADHATKQSQKNSASHWGAREAVRQKSQWLGNGSSPLQAGGTEQGGGHRAQAQLIGQVCWGSMEKIPAGQGHSPFASQRRNVPCPHHGQQ